MKNWGENMKKCFAFCLLLVSCCLLSGCFGNESEDIVSSFEKAVEKSKAYHVSGELEIVNNEESYLYDVEVAYKDDDYFRVSLKNKTKELLLKQEKEKEFSLLQKGKQDKLVKSLKNREQELKAELRKQQKASNQLNKKIQDLIAKQTAEAAKKQKSKSQAAKGGGYAMTQKEKVVAGGFLKNKGLLMWPTKGTITGKFGKHAHPVLKDVVINNKGIYITAVPGSKANCIYDGVVSQCFSVPGSNNAVIVRHGNYLTVYANLTEMYVKKGDNIKRGAAIGKIYQDPDNKNKATLFFQIWKEKELLNPQLWLRK